jgi:hypothetical protein
MKTRVNIETYMKAQVAQAPTPISGQKAISAVTIEVLLDIREIALLIAAKNGIKIEFE